MRSLSFALIAILALGCPRSRQAETTTDTVSTSGTVVTGTASKTSTGSTGGVVSTLSADDKQFFISAAKMNITEINASRVAVDQASKANVQSFANHELADHDNLDHELRDLALKKGVALPTEVTTPALGNVDVDHAYLQRIITDHAKAVGDFTNANLKDPDLRAWAAKTLPMLRDHLAKAKALSAS